MCGIAGVIDSNSDVVKYAVAALNKAQAHRGPDDEGIEILPMRDGWLGLGHRRLAIIDVTPAGHQPMQDPNTDNWITFNGEIYNFQELRGELEGKDERFWTGTDTEVILKAYTVWGIDCVKRLHGIFAFGLWDTGKQRLLLARDQLGVKPLYLFQKGKTLIFASEVRAILATGLVDRKLCHDGLLSYMAYGSVQEPFTMIQDTRSLGAGELLVWENGATHTERYWNLPAPESISATAPKSLYEEMERRLTDAVASQLVSDVPLGAFLSGGIDSTAIVALAAKASTTPIKTFSIIFKEAKYDERQWSRLAAQYIGSDHTEVELTNDRLFADLPTALQAFDQPSVDGLNTYFVSKAAKEAGLTVALSGVGGDEVFGGYDGYRKSLVLERYHSAIRLLPAFLRRGLSSLIGTLDHSEAFRKLSDLLVAERDPYFVSRLLFNNKQMRSLLDEDIAITPSWEDQAFGLIESDGQGYDSINKISAFETQTYMRSTLLRDTDQMSMAHAIEVRVPLIDPWLVDFCFTLPGSCKLDAKEPKPLLTKSLAGLIPAECVNRPKMGFELPFQACLGKNMNEMLTETFVGTNSNLFAPFNKKGLATIWDQFNVGQVSWSRVWASFVLLKWIQGQRLRI